ncbi:MAG: Flp family type IVb pilin [Novosphingobium sp.]
MLDFVRKPLVDQSGATAIEYGMLIGVIAMSLFFGMSAFTNQLISVWTDIVARSPTTVKS